MAHLHIPLVDLGLGHEALVARELADAPRPAEEEVRRAGLGEEEEHDDGDGRGRPDGLEERPAPGLCGDGEPRKQGAEGGYAALVAVYCVQEVDGLELTSAVGGSNPSHHGIRERYQAVNIPERRTARRQARRAEETSQEPQDHQAGIVLRKGRRDGQDNKQPHRSHVHRIPPDDWDFTQGGEDQRPNPVTQNVEREAEGGLDGADAKGPLDALLGGDVNGGRGVHDEGVEADDERDAEPLPIGPVVRVLRVVAVVPVDQDGTVSCALGDDGDGLGLLEAVVSLFLEALLGVSHR